MDRDELKRLIADEIRRVLGEMREVRASAEPTPLLGEGGTQSPTTATPSASIAGPGIVLLTGSDPLAPSIAEALAGLTRYGAEISLLLSHTFSQTQGDAGAQLGPGIERWSDIEDEASLARRVAAASWLVVPDVSANTLHKAVAGIEDSAPSRAIALAIARGRPLVFVECAGPPSPGTELPRLAALRRLERRGARLARPETLIEVIVEAAAPRDRKEFQPPPAQTPRRRKIVTSEDVVEAASRGMRDLLVPEDAIVTAEAIETAQRRGVEIRRSEAR